MASFRLRQWWVLGALVVILLAARTLMGIGSAIITPLAMSVMLVVFPKEEQPRALAAWAAASFIGLPLGPCTAWTSRSAPERASWCSPRCSR